MFFPIQHLFNLLFLSIRYLDVNHVIRATVIVVCVWSGDELQYQKKLWTNRSLKSRACNNISSTKDQFKNDLSCEELFRPLFFPKSTAKSKESKMDLF